MSILFRILLTIYAFCLTIISLFSIFVTFKPQLFDVIMGRFYYVLNNPRSSIVLLVVELVFLVLSIMFFSLGFKSNKEKRSVSKFTNVGEIKISLTAIENIVLGVSKKINGVKEAKVYVRKQGDSVSVAVKLVIMSDVNIPVLSEDIQNRSKKSIEESSGISVNDVKVLIDSIYSGYKSGRVE